MGCYSDGGNDMSIKHNDMVLSLSFCGERAFCFQLFVSLTFVVYFCNSLSVLPRGGWEKRLETKGVGERIAKPTLYLTRCVGDSVSC